MYIKLAYRNVKKSYKDFLVYFVTLTFSVALFYVFNSFESQSLMLELDAASTDLMKSLSEAMSILSVLVSIIFGFLILYANNFLMKRRKKELGMYTLLGMQKRKINLILIYETFFIGVASLLSGMILGIVLSQATATLSARLIDVPVNFKFVFSYETVILVILSFSIIFIISGLLNLIVLKSHNLIDLLTAERTNQVYKFKNNATYFVLALSLAGTIIAYKMALDPDVFLNKLSLIVGVGALSTLGIFYSLSNMIMSLPSRFNNYYFKNLNTFVFRQIGSKIKTTYKMMTVVSLMLLLGIGALATSFNINSILSKQFKDNNPYDLSLELNYTDDTNIKDLKEEITGIDFHYKAINAVDMYYPGINLIDMKNDFFSTMPADETNLIYPIAIANLDGYNSLRRNQNLPEIILDKKEVALFSAEDIRAQDQVFGSNNYTLSESFVLGANKFKIANNINENDYKISLMNAAQPSLFVIVMNEEDLFDVKLELNKSGDHDNIAIFNIDFFENQNEDNEINVVKNHLGGIEKVNIDNVNYYNYFSKLNEAENINTSILLFTYAGLYIGVVFIISSAVVLALQLLSEASENKSRYLMLSKLGVSNEMARASIFKQILIYFIFPMFIALIHSWIGIKAFNKIIATDHLYSSSNKMIYLTTLSVIIVYLLYFLFTYKSSVEIIENKDN